MKNVFTSTLMYWHVHDNDRKMPWKGERDPYKIWLSEIILQQTRVEQGWAYYEKFILAFPTVINLADAADEVVFKMWEGLGYYSRCRNLLFTARLIKTNYGGVFPKEYPLLLQLKGVGAYTAAAIASFAFDLPFAVVDGNVIRVLSRYFGILEPTDQTSTKKQLDQLAQSLIDTQNPAQYNQAIMDFGATVCKPQQVLCNQCPLRETCYAMRHDKVDELPVKSKKIVIKQRFFSYHVVHDAKGVYVRSRQEKDIWQGLYEFILIEKKSEKDLLPYKQPPILQSIEAIQVDRASKIYFQKLTHQHVAACFHLIKLPEKLDLEGHIYVTFKEMSQLAFPSLINMFLAEISNDSEAAINFFI